jgi:hypothetical protein
MPCRLFVAVPIITESLNAEYDYVLAVPLAILERYQQYTGDTNTVGIAPLTTHQLKVA